MNNAYLKIISIFFSILAIALPVVSAQQQGGFNRATLMDSGGSLADLDPSPAAILISGRVTMDNGSAPPERVLIELVCNNNPHPEGYTDSKGRFSLQLGQNQGIVPNASVETIKGFSSTAGGSQTGPVRGSELRNCDVRAALPGFRSDAIYLNNHTSLDNPDMGTIVLHRQANVEGFTISATSVDARKAFEKGLVDLKKKKIDDARKDFEKATGIYPKYAAAWLQLGMIDEQANQSDQARAAYNKAVAADSKYINPYMRLCVIAYDASRWQEVADSTSQVLRLNPYDFPAAHYLNSVANLELNNLDAAEKGAREFIKMDAQRRQPRARYLLGLILVRQHKFTEGVACMREYLTSVPDAAQGDEVRKQIAEVDLFLEKSAVGVLHEPALP